MSPTAIVGEALVRVRVISDKLSNDIRDAVKKGVADSRADIEREAEGVGDSFGKGTATGIRKSRKNIDAEIRDTARRFTVDANGIVSRAGEDVGRNFNRAIGSGIRNNDRDIGREIESTFQRAIGSGGGGSGLERVGQDTGRRFVRAIESGFQEDVRKVFNLRPGDIDDNLGGGAAGARVGDNIDRGFRSRFARLRAAADQAAQNMAASLGRNLRSFRDSGGLMGDATHESFLGRMKARAKNIENDIGNTFNSIGDRIGNKFGRILGRSTTAGLRDARPDLERGGDDAGNAATRGIQRSMRRNNPGLISTFSNIGKDLFKHFNLGFGAARMGPAIISILTTAGPSIIAAGAAIFTSMAAEIITLLGAIGPGLAGGLGVGIAAVSTLALNFGLLYLAMNKAFKTVEGAKIKDAFKEIGNIIGTPVAAGLLEGMLASVNRLKDALPQLTDLLRETGKGFGGIITGILDTVSSAKNMERIKGILSTNITFLDNFKGGIVGLVDSFLILFNAAKPFIDYIGQGIKRFGEWASASLSVSEANGSLATWMQGMLDSFKDLLHIVVEFGRGIGDVFSAASPASESLLGSIRNTAEAFHRWTSDTGNMEKMTAFFDKAHIITSKIFEVLGSIFKAGGNAFASMNIDPLIHVLDTIQNVVGPAIARFFNQIQAGASANFVKAFDNIGTALTKIADSGSFERVANLISTIILKLSEFAASDIGSKILGIVLPFAIMGGLLTSLVGPVLALGKAFFTLGVFAFGGETALAGLAAAAAPFIAIAAAIAAAFVLIYVNSEKFRTSISGLLSTMGGAFSSVWDTISPKIEVLWSKLNDLAAVIGDKLAPIIDFIAPILARAISFIGDSIGNLMDLLGGFIDVLIGVFTGDWNKVWDGVKEIFSAVWSQILNVFEMAKSALSFAWDAIVNIFFNAGQILSNFFGSIWDGFLNVVSIAWGAITDFLSGTWNAIFALASGVWGDITGFFSSVWNGITEGASTAWNGVTTFLSGVWNGISQTASTIWNGIIGFFSGIWNGIQTGARVAWNIIKGIVLGVIGIGGAIIQGLLAFGNLILQIVLAPFRLVWLLLKPIWDGITDSLAIAWASIREIATTIWGGISSFFRTIWNGVSDFIIGIWDDITSWLQERWTNIQNIASTVWGAITEFFSGIWNGISEGAQVAWEAVTSFLSDRWTNIQNIASTIWGAITTFFSDLWTNIQNGISVAWEAITSFLSDRWTNIQNVATTVWTAISTFFTTIWTTITNAFHVALDALTSWLSDRWTNIQNVATTIWNGISSFFSTIWNAISTTFHSIVDPLVSWLSDRWNAISSTASDIWNGIVGIASTAWENIKSAVLNAISPVIETLAGYWEDIKITVQTAWDGVAGVVGGIWDEIKDSIWQPIADAWTNVTEWVGKIKEAITSAWDTVSGIVTDINTAIATAADAIVNAPTAASVGAGQATPGGTASGGIIRPTPGGQLRRLAEVGKPERVEPLDSKGLSDRDYAMIQRLGLGGGAGGDVTVRVFIGQQELTSIIDTQVERNQNQLGRDVKNGRF